MASSGGTGGGGGPAAPFEWLSGGLFFGKGGGSKNSAIGSCTDAKTLLDGVESDLDKAALVVTSGMVTEDAKEGKGGNTEDALSGREASRDGSIAASDPPSSPVGTESAEEQDEQLSDLAARLSRVKFLLYDERRTPSSSTSRTVAFAVVKCLTATHSNLVPRLLTNLEHIPFESRKDVSSIFNYLLVCGFDGSGPGSSLYRPAMDSFAQYVYDNYERIMTPIVAGHDCGTCVGVVAPPAGTTTAPAAAAATTTTASTSPDVALHCGTMLRSTLRHPPLYHLLVSPPNPDRYVYPFLDTYVHAPNFDVASDALETLRLILTGGAIGGAGAGVGGAGAAGNELSASAALMTADPAVATEMAAICSEFLLREYVPLFEQRFNPRMLSEGANYINRRVALQLLSTILLSRSNYEVMIRYISSRKNLQLIMCLLRDPSPHITLDAFHVFKIFVANPNKPDDVVKILVDNKVKLCRYLDTLHKERELNDEQFRDEKALVISTLEAL